jgi:hypothetical protein
MLDEKKMPREPAEVREQLKKDLTQRLMDQIDSAIIAELSEKQADEFNKMLDDPATTDARIEEFMKSTGIDRGRVALETMLRFKSLYIGN